MSAQRQNFDWLGTSVRVLTDGEPLLEMLRSLWGHTLSTGGAGGRPDLTLEFRFGGVDGPRFIGPERSCPLDRRDPVLHAYNRFVSEMMGRVGGHLVFHAASVCADGRAMLISAPSTFGKTTLGLHLASGGFGLLADDVTIVERSSGRILPFTRPLNLRSGTRSTLDDLQMERVSRAALDDSGEEWTVDPGRWLVEGVDPGPISMVVITRPRRDGAATRRFPRYEIRLVDTADRETALEVLEALKGVTEVRADPEDVACIEVRVESPAGLSEWIDRHGDDIVYALKLALAPPDFDVKPALEPIGTFQAAVELCQEMFNRRRDSVLEREFRGRETLLVAEIAGLLGSADCYALLPGRLETTLEMLRERFGSTGP